MGALAAAFLQKENEKYLQMTEYLSSEEGYWLKEDKWYMGDESFSNAGITVPEGRWLLADFSAFRSDKLKNEIKYYYLYSMKNKWLTVNYLYRKYGRVVVNMGIHLEKMRIETLAGLKELYIPDGLSDTEKKAYQHLYNGAVEFVTDYYDEREEYEKDVWQLSAIAGVKASATMIRQKGTLNFQEIPPYYRETVKRFLSRLVVRRSCSHCCEMLFYIRYFYRVFYGHGYKDGFFEGLNRRDMERYFGWVAADYEDKNATFRSKAVSYIRQYIDYVQLAEYEQSPVRDVGKLIFEDDIPRRERAEDTMNKVKYIPGPVREQLDSCIQELEPKEMRPIYILLRESGWRGTDILNLRYDNCLDYLWNSREKEYVPYLCGEITKTGIPMLKIPIRTEVADMLIKLREDAGKHSTDENNPDRYLFNTYEGRNMGLPYSKPAFTKAVQDLINRKGILDGDGNPYHFKAHSLRHTRAMEYAEQGMPIGIIQQVLGHCSLQMTVHYSKVSENMLYEKWKETEKLNLLHLDSRPPQKCEAKEEGLHYEFIRKNLDAVKVPFGVCFKPSKLPCRQQTAHCMECANFCTCEDNISEYEAEIARTEKLVEISRKLQRNEWITRNEEYLEKLEKMLVRIRTEGVVHKNGALREDFDGR